jgi:ABC-type uncharacterized transport system permease subunit
MLFGTTLVAIIALACVAQYTGSPWIDLAKYSAVGRLHVVFGVLTVFLAVLQVISGFLIDKFYDARRISVPW